MSRKPLWLALLFCGFANAQEPSVAAPPQQQGVAPTQQQSLPVVSGQQPHQQPQTQQAIPPLPSPFPTVLDLALPLSPDQIKQLRQQQDRVKRAASDPARKPPKPRLRNHVADLSPGSTPPVVRLAAGHGTGISFNDSTGAPWPIEAIDLANKEDFSAVLSVPGTSVVTMNASSEYGQGNMLVFLKTMATPVVVTLLSGQQDVDYRLDIHIPGYGPNAKPQPVPVDPTARFNPLLSDVLDGVVPAGVKTVNIDGVSGMAWRMGDTLLLRTRYTLMSPAPRQVSQSQDGTKAYELDYTPQIVVSADGKLLQWRVSE